MGFLFSSPAACQRYASPLGRCRPGHANYAFVQEFACVTPSRCQEFTCPPRNESLRAGTTPAIDDLAPMLACSSPASRRVTIGAFAVRLRRSVDKIVLLKIVSLDRRFWPAYPVESVMRYFFFFFTAFPCTLALQSPLLSLNGLTSSIFCASKVCSDCEGLSKSIFLRRFALD